MMNGNQEYKNCDRERKRQGKREKTERKEREIIKETET